MMTHKKPELEFESQNEYLYDEEIEKSSPYPPVESEDALDDLVAELKEWEASGVPWEQLPPDLQQAIQVCQEYQSHLLRLIRKAIFGPVLMTQLDLLAAVSTNDESKLPVIVLVSAITAFLLFKIAQSLPSLVHDLRQASLKTVGLITMANPDIYPQDVNPALVMRRVITSTRRLQRSHRTNLKHKQGAAAAEQLRAEIAKATATGSDPSQLEVPAKAKRR